MTITATGRRHTSPHLRERRLVAHVDLVESHLGAQFGRVAMLALVIVKMKNEPTHTLLRGRRTLLASRQVCECRAPPLDSG